MNTPDAPPAKTSGDIPPEGPTVAALRRYGKPVGLLLALGQPGGDSVALRNAPFEDYAALGISAGHADGLLAMTRDQVLMQAEIPLAYAPIHAARALAVLGVVKAIPRLIDLLLSLDKRGDDEWLEDMPGVLARFGEPALAPVLAAARDQRLAFGARLFLIDVFELVGNQDASLRQRCLDGLRSILEVAQWNDETLNGHVIAAIIDLNGTELLPLIRRAYDEELVDEQCCGPLEEVEADITITKDARLQRTRAALERAAADPKHPMHTLAMAIPKRDGSPAGS